MSCRSQTNGARQASSDEAGGAGISQAHPSMAASGSLPAVCAAPDTEAAAELVAEQPLAQMQVPTPQAGMTSGCFKPVVHWLCKVAVIANNGGTMHVHTIAANGCVSFRVWPLTQPLLLPVSSMVCACRTFASVLAKL